MGPSAAIWPRNQRWRRVIEAHAKGAMSDRHGHGRARGRPGMPAGGGPIQLKVVGTSHASRPGPMPPVCTRRATTSNVRAENTWKKKGEIDRRSRIERRVRRLRRPLAEQNDRKAELEVECAGADGNLRSKSAVKEQKPAPGGSGKGCVH